MDARQASWQPTSPDRQRCRASFRVSVPNYGAGRKREPLTHDDLLSVRVMKPLLLAPFHR